ncbi:MAG: hypothetical protein PUF48_01780 [Oscillospiraceae bacterium]|nr:hypothetical protein [Oscillospiraceae bacterium]
MKKHSAILNRVEQYKQKQGINYTNSSSRIFLILKVFLSVFFTWSVIMNLLTILSWSLRIGTESFKYVSDNFYTILFLTILSIIGFVFVFTKLKLVGTIILPIPSIYTMFVYAPLLEDATNTLGYKTIFFTRHVIPNVAIAIIALIMLSIILFAHFKSISLYKNTEKTIYKEYADKKEKNNLDITWEEYLDTIE